MKKILLLTSIFSLNMLMAEINYTRSVTKTTKPTKTTKAAKAAKAKMDAKRKATASRAIAKAARAKEENAKLLVANELLFDNSEYQKIKALDPVAIKVLSADAKGDGFVYTVYTLVPQENVTSGKYELETQKAKIIDEASFNDYWLGEILDSYIDKNDNEMQKQFINDSL